jgi:hypothetical protein
VKTIDRFNGKTEVVGPSFDDWVTLSANITVNSTISGLRKDGNFFLDEKSVDLSLDLLEYVKTKSHTHEMGGGLEMTTNELINSVKDKLQNDKFVEELYWYRENGKYTFIIKTTDHDPDINLHLSEIYWEIYDEIEEKFEFKPIPKEYFSNFDLPPNAIKILGS